MKIGKASEFFRNIDQSLLDEFMNLTGRIARHLDPGDTFEASDNPERLCCLHLKGPPVVISPYDVARMRMAAYLTSKEFFTLYAHLALGKKSQLPLAILKSGLSVDSNRRLCPFQYEHENETIDSRPLHCRLHPLARVVDQAGVSYFVLRDLSNCQAHRSRAKRFTLETWLEFIDAEEYIDRADRYHQLLVAMDYEKYKALRRAEKHEFGEMLYTPDSLVPNDLIGNILRLPECAEAALELGYAMAEAFIALRVGYCLET